MYSTKYSPEGFFANLFGKKQPVVTKQTRVPEPPELSVSSTVETLLKLPELNGGKITISADNAIVLKTNKISSISPDGSISKVLKGIESSISSLESMIFKLDNLTSKYNQAYARLDSLDMVGASPEIIFKVGSDVEKQYLNIGNMSSKIGDINKYNLLGIAPGGDLFKGTRPVTLDVPSQSELEHLVDIVTGPFWTISKGILDLRFGATLDSSDHPFRSMDREHPLANKIFSLKGIFDGDEDKDKQYTVFHTYTETGCDCIYSIKKLILEIIIETAKLYQVSPVYQDSDLKKWQKAL